MWLIRSTLDALWAAGEPFFRLAAGFLLFVWLTSATWPLVPAILSMIGAFVVGRLIRDMRARSQGW